MASGVTLSMDWRSTLVSAAEEYQQTIRGMLLDLANIWSARLVDAAQSDAVWTDRTANARQGLTAEVIDRGDVIEICLFHTMEYGIWLEVANDGTYAIIMKTVDRMAPGFFAAARALVS
jgi:hypothetical protein